MSLLELRCSKCGGELKSKGEIFECGYCHTTYLNDRIEKETEALRAVLDEQKQEKLASLRHMLWEAIHAKYIDSDTIVHLSRSLRKLRPDDFEARFFEVANAGNEGDVNEFLRETDLSDDEAKFWAEEVVKFMIKSLRAKNLLSVQSFIERAFKDEDLKKYEEYSTKFSEEAAKVKGGVYAPNEPRDVFVMYSGKDMKEVEELVEDLEERGLTCFVAMRNLQHGKGAVANYQKALEQAMRACKTVVFVSSKNSRSMGCDAVRIEMPYFMEQDKANAPYEYRQHYEKMPQKYKKPRVEYRLDNEKGGSGLVKEFFGGLEFVYSKSEVAKRIERALTENVEEKPSEKICVSCGAKNPIETKFCMECGGKEFAEDEKEYREKREKREKEALQEAEKKNRELAAKLEALEKEKAAEKAGKNTAEADRASEELLARLKKFEAAQEEEAKRKAQESKEAEERNRALMEELKKIKAATHTETPEEKAAREAEEKRKKEEDARLLTRHKNGLVYFGSYPQTQTKTTPKLRAVADAHGYYTDDEKNRFAKRGVDKYTKYYAVEPIAWRILSQENGKLRLISNKILEKKTYEEACIWLKDEFAKTVFDAEERKIVESVSLLSGEDLLRYGYVKENSKAFVKNSVLLTGWTGYELMNSSSPWWTTSTTFSKKKHAQALHKGVGFRDVCGILGEMASALETNPCGVVPVIELDEKKLTVLEWKEAAHFGEQRALDRLKTELDERELKRIETEMNAANNAKDFEIKNGVLEKYTGKGGDVIIPEGVKELSYSVFASLSNITSIRLPRSLKKFGWMKYKDDSCLSNIYVDENNPNFLSIDGNLYSKDGKTLLRYGYGKEDAKFMMPIGVTEIAGKAFESCNNLKQVVFADTVERVGEYAFLSCPKLQKVQLSSALTKIGIGAFKFCEKLKEIELPNTLEVLGGAAFCGCSALTEISVPNGITVLSGDVFAACSRLSVVRLGNGIEEIKEGAFSGCKKLREVKIPSSVKTIRQWAFRDCSELEHIYIPDTVTTMEGEVFNGCTALTIHTEFNKEPSGWKENGLYSKGYNPEKRLVIFGEIVDEERYKAKLAAEEKNKAEEEARKRAEEERKRVETERARKIEEEKRRVAEAKRKAEEEARKKAEEERKKAEEVAKKKAEEANKKAAFLAQEVARCGYVRQGDFVFFGQYPQGRYAPSKIGKENDNGYFDGGDGFLYQEYDEKYYRVEPIKWRILKEEHGELFLIADQILNECLYSGQKGTSDYEKSGIRYWLNNRFFDFAFDKRQQEMIAETSVETVGFKNQRTYTLDKVFLPDDEWRPYNETASQRNAARKRTETDYASVNGREHNFDAGAWWYRQGDPSYKNYAAYIDGTGEKRDNNTYAQCGVVPALKLVVDKKAKEARLADLKRGGWCVHCGGVFKGLFSKTCKNCGRKKDY